MTSRVSNKNPLITTSGPASPLWNKPDGAGHQTTQQPNSPSPFPQSPSGIFIEGKKNGEGSSLTIPLATSNLPLSDSPSMTSRSPFAASRPRGPWPSSFLFRIDKSTPYPLGVPVPGRCTHLRGLLKQPDDHGPCPCPCPCPFPTMADPSPGLATPYDFRRFRLEGTVKRGGATIGGRRKIPNPHPPFGDAQEFQAKGGKIPGGSPAPTAQS